jgi:hypothetical protein
MEPPTLLALDLELRTEDERLVHGWRAEQLEACGLPAPLARRYADVVDWHDLAVLVERGCPPELALRILR